MKWSEIAQKLRPYVVEWIDDILGSREWSTADDATWIQGTPVPTDDKTGNRGTDVIDLQINQAGADDIASGDYAVIGGGKNNQVSEDYSSILGGNGNRIIGTGSTSAIVGGALNTVSRPSSFVITGGENYVQGEMSGILAGAGGQITHDYTMAWGVSPVSRSSHSVTIGNKEAADGDAQLAIYILREEIVHSDTAWHSLYLTGTSSISIPEDSTFVFDVMLVGTTNGATKSFGFKITGVIENDGGTTAILGTPTVTTLYDADDVSFDAQAVADDANDRLLIQVQDTDGASDSVIWVARVDTVEVVHYY